MVMTARPYGGKKRKGNEGTVLLFPVFPGPEGKNEKKNEIAAKSNLVFSIIGVSRRRA